MEERKRSAGKGAEWGAIIVNRLDYCIFIILEAEIETEFRLIAQP